MPHGRLPVLDDVPAAPLRCPRPRHWPVRPCRGREGLDRSPKLLAPVPVGVVGDRQGARVLARSGSGSRTS
eukprot:4899752-Alexandrium_andersonii.AAC.1